MDGVWTSAIGELHYYTRSLVRDVIRVSAVMVTFTSLICFGHSPPVAFVLFLLNLPPPLCVLRCTNETPLPCSHQSSIRVILGVCPLLWLLSFSHFSSWIPCSMWNKNLSWWIKWCKWIHFRNLPRSNKKDSIIKCVAWCISCASKKLSHSF